MNEPRQVIRREEMLSATLELGGAPISLADYATTGLLAMAVGPQGNGKTNAGLVIGEQLSAQGWVSVLVDPEGELEGLYGAAVTSADELRDQLTTREKSIIVVRALDAAGFIPYGRAIFESADDVRKPIYVMIDEGQLFSDPKKRKGDIAEAANIINDFAGRGRKRALDLFITSLRSSNTVHRALFSARNLTLIGCQEDPAVWASLAPQLKPYGVSFKDLNSLTPGEFYCLSRRGIDKIRMPMATALKSVALPSKPVKRKLPGNYSQWARAMAAITDDRLQVLDETVVALLGAVAGLSKQQMMAGATALQDELEARA